MPVLSFLVQWLYQVWDCFGTSLFHFGVSAFLFHFRYRKCTKINPKVVHSLTRKSSTQTWYNPWLILRPKVVHYLTKKTGGLSAARRFFILNKIIYFFREHLLILAIAYMIWNSAFHFLIFVATKTVITTVRIVILRLVQNRHSKYFAASTPTRTILTGTGTARRICNNVLSVRQNRTIHKSLIPETTLFLIFATLLPSLPPAVRRTAKKNLQKQVP